MDSEFLSLLAQARILVGFLGESNQFAWWRTSFYEPASLRFLEPVFPRTSALAQYHGVVEAARLVHDEGLSAGSYHLFRLPEELEQDLHGLMGAQAAEITNDSTREKYAALKLLAGIAGMPATRSEGPSAVGSVNEIRSPAVVRRIAALYSMAFDQGIRSYPYLVR